MENGIEGEIAQWGKVSGASVGGSRFKIQDSRLGENQVPGVGCQVGAGAGDWGPGKPKYQVLGVGL
jgi:hypothetical protein